MPIRIQKGSLLIDAAIALVIVGLLMTGIYTLYLQQFNQPAKVRQQLSGSQIGGSADQALKTFLKTNGYLPCPDTNLDGTEDRNGNNCVRNYGALPWLNLGLSAQDVKTRAGYFLYQVHKRAKTSSDMGNICEPASLFLPPSTSYTIPTSGTYQLHNTFGYACVKTPTHSGSWSTTAADLRSTDAAPMHLATPPVGADNAGPAGKLTIKLTDGTTLSDVAVYAIVAFGGTQSIWDNNGNIVNCTQRTNADQQENCNLDSTLIADAPEDKLVFLSPHEAKYLLLIGGHIK